MIFPTERLLKKYQVELIDSETYWTYYESEFISHDHRYLFVDFDQYLKEQIGKQNKTGIYCHIRDKNKVIAIFHGYQKDHYTFDMVHSVVHEKYRNQGIYTALLERVIQFSKNMGHAMITSTHSPANNPILIAKLKKGFYLTAMEIDPRFGMNAKLTYYHDSALRDAYKFRCGELFFNKTMQQYSHNSFNVFCDKVKKET